MIRHRRLGRILFAAVALVAGSSCANEAPDHFTDADGERIVGDPRSEDALEWLKAPTANSKLSGAMSDEQALALAYKFQQNGAVRMVVPSDDQKTTRPNDRPGMIVELPADPAKRSALFRLYAKQVRNSGYAPQADRDQKYLYVPWAREGAGR